MKWKVPYIDLPLQFAGQQEKITAEFKRVMSGGSFILRDDVAKFEQNLATYLGVKHVVGVNSGTDALYLSTAAVGIKPADEVITVAHSFVATIAAIIHRSARPVLVDISEDFNIDVEQIEEKITRKTRAIIPVHLNGRVCRMDRLGEIAEKYGLVVIEDAAQALGSMYKGKKAGSFGLAGCFSLHPMKTLSCAGDGGFVSTDDDELAEKMRLLRDHGQKTKTDLAFFGYNSRLDNLQAAILNIKFENLDKFIERRREIASVYAEKLSDLPLVLPPAPSSDGYFDTYNSYVIRSECQQELFSFLRDKGIEVFIHISKPLYHYKKLKLTEDRLPVNEKICKEILSLPIYPEMTGRQLDYVVDNLHSFFKGK